MVPEFVDRAQLHDPGRADAAARQAEIWAQVRETQLQLSRSVGTPVAPTASPSSLQFSLENAKLRDAQAAYFDAFRSAAVFAINGKITGGDVYASSALFRKMWRKLLIANITEAISEKNGARASQPSLDDVQAFLTAADSVPRSEQALNTGVRLAITASKKQNPPALAAFTVDRRETTFLFSVEQPREPCLAQSRRDNRADGCTLSGVRRTFFQGARMSSIWWSKTN